MKYKNDGLADVDYKTRLSSYFHYLNSRRLKFFKFIHFTALSLNAQGPKFMA